MEIITQHPIHPTRLRGEFIEQLGILGIYIMKIKKHSSCEIEYFVETHLCKLCVILRSRVLRVVCPHKGYRSATPLATTV